MVANPLHLPELLSQILQWLEDDPAALQSACRVNPTWFEEATKVLWRNAPYGVFSKFDIDPSRRQIYANKFLTVSFKACDKKVKTILQRLRFPQLKHLIPNSYSERDNHKIKVRFHIEKYFQPTLETLRIGYEDLPEVLKDHTSFKLPKLHELRLDHISTSVDVSRFLEFLQNLPSLKSLVLGDKVDHFVTDQTLRYLVNRQNLVKLEIIEHLFTRSVIEDAVTLASVPFKNLQCLEMRINSDSTSALVRAISNGLMKELKLWIEGHGSSVLDHVSSIKQLQSLEVWYCADNLTIPREEIMTLQSLSQLRKLILMEIDSAYVESIGMDDEHMKQLTTHFKQLQEFTYGIRDDLSISSIIAIAENCPTLKMLELFGGYDLQALLNVEEVLFPYLKRLQLLDAGLEDPYDQNFTEKDAALLLRRHAPRLNELEFTDLGDEFSAEVRRQFEGTCNRNESSEFIRIKLF